MQRFLLLLLVFLAFAVPACNADELSIKTGYSHGSVRVHGKKRTYRLYVPCGYSKGQPFPLVIVLHGGLGSGWSAGWDSRMSEQAEKRQFVVAYPNGAWRTWNADGCCGPARVLKVDDVGLVQELIDHLKIQLPIDADRVCVTGISNGGMMVYKLANELSTEIAAIAPIEGCMYSLQKNSFDPVSVIVVHGTRDRIIRYDGGTGSMFGYKVTSQSVADTVKFWVDHDHCKTPPVHEENGEVVKDLYTNGRARTEVCVYTLTKSGHAWPGGRRCVFAGDRPVKDFSATDAICDFFLSHPKLRD